MNNSPLPPVFALSNFVISFLLFRRQAILGSDTSRPRLSPNWDTLGARGFIWHGPILTHGSDSQTQLVDYDFKTIRDTRRKNPPDSCKKSSNSVGPCQLPNNHPPTATITAQHVACKPALMGRACRSRVLFSSLRLFLSFFLHFPPFLEKGQVAEETQAT